MSLDAEIANWLIKTEPDEELGTLDELRAHAVRTSAQALATMLPDMMPASETNADADGIPVRVLRPNAESSATPTIVYFHGGGWVLGSIDTHLGHARRICQQTKAVVVSVGYRLAPENPFPAAFDDAVAATEWAARTMPGTHLVVAGDSAGAQLAASVAIARRDAGQPLDAQLLLYPVTDVKGRYRDVALNEHYWSRKAAATRFGLTLAGMVDFATRYVSEEESGDWRVSPMQADSLVGVAPAVVHTATLDVLRTEGNFYADKLAADGVRVVRQEHPTLNHSYFGLGGISAVADAAAGQAAEDLRSLLD